MIKPKVSSRLSGQGILSRVMTTAYSYSSGWRGLVAASYIRAIRWPNAGHKNLEISHYGLRHTNSYPSFPDVAEGNSWDPAYDYPASAGDPEEILTLEGMADLAIALDLSVMLLLTWKSAYLTTGGEPFQNPDPKDIDGNAIPVGTGTPVEQQMLENRRLLKAYFSRGGPPPVLMVGGEDLYLGWDNAEVVPWPEVAGSSGRDQASWVGPNVALFYRDAQAFLAENGWTAKWGFAFNEATSGGTVIPALPFQVVNNRDKFVLLHASLGSLCKYAVCSLHYRRTFAQWLAEPRMTFSFFTDSGMGTLDQIRAFIKQLTAARGAQVDLILYANSVGNIDVDAPTGAQCGLMAAQYLMEAADAGYPFIYGYPGFVGDNVQAGAQGTSVLAVNNVPNPIFYALALVSEIYVNEPRLQTVEGTSETLIAQLVSWKDVGSTARRVALFILNKAPARRVTLKLRGVGWPLPPFDEALVYSEAEPTIQEAVTNRVIAGRQITLDLAENSLTRVLLKDPRLARNTMLRWQTKDPDDITDYGIDWTGRLDANETISTSTWILSPEGAQDLVFGTETIYPTETRLRTSGGTHGLEYVITNRIVTSKGRMLDLSVTLDVKEK